MIPESMKLEPKDEFIRYRKKDCFMIPHDSFVAKAWSFILINLLLYTATVMPFKIALIEDEDSYPLFVIDTAIDFLYIIDIFVNFNTPIKRKED